MGSRDQRKRQLEQLQQRPAQLFIAGFGKMRMIMLLWMVQIVWKKLLRGFIGLSRIVAAERIKERQERQVIKQRKKYYRQRMNIRKRVVTILRN